MFRQSWSVTRSFNQSKSTASRPFRNSRMSMRPSRLASRTFHATPRSYHFRRIASLTALKSASPLSCLSALGLIAPFRDFRSPRSVFGLAGLLLLLLGLVAFTVAFARSASTQKRASTRALGLPRFLFLFFGFDGPSLMFARFLSFSPEPPTLDGGKAFSSSLAKLIRLRIQAAAVPNAEGLASNARRSLKYLSAGEIPRFQVSFRRHTGQSANPLDSDSPSELDPCIRHRKNVQCLRPNV
mmetsp:Transcript_32396/g.62544  ORF Transcript_32396/g.62544 Transcript_32396/m.62544 type:complete len:241 (-) Transcript_32396:765-1487(-)